MKQVHGGGYFLLNPVHQTVKMILHIVLGTSGKIATNLCPSISQHIMKREKKNILLLRPPCFAKLRSEVIQPSLTTLCLRQQIGHTCFPVRPGIRSAIIFHFFSPYFLTSSLSSSSSLFDQGTQIKHLQCNLHVYFSSLETLYQERSTSPYPYHYPSCHHHSFHS